MPDPIVNIIRGSRKRNLDPAAVLAVADQEGLSGRIGDNGHAYGPFQLNNAGGVITGTRPGVNSQAIQTWAQSPAGIGFALDRIARVAAGKRGRDAVAAIVSQFERPADIPGEIARAQAGLSKFGAISPVKVGGAPASSSLAAPPQPSPDVLQLLAAGASMFGLDPLPLQTIAEQPAAQPARTLPAAKTPKAAKTGSTIRFLEHVADPFGLAVTATTGGKHVKGSYHYRGRAIDVAGDPAKMAALAAQALTHPGDFAEMFYTGPGNPGFFIKNGRVFPIGQLDKSVAAGHKNHVHLAA